MAKPSKRKRHQRQAVLRKPIGKPFATLPTDAEIDRMLPTLPVPPPPPVVLGKLGLPRLMAFAAGGACASAWCLVEVDGQLRIEGLQTIVRRSLAAVLDGQAGGPYVLLGVVPSVPDAAALRSEIERRVAAGKAAREAQR